MTGHTLARVAAAVWAAAIVVVIAGAALVPAVDNALANNGPGCPFRAVFHIDCPFCGMTRASLALGRGQLHEALTYHPFAPLVLLGTLTLLITVAIGRAELLLRGRRPFVLLAAIGLVWILRLVLD